MVPGQDPFPEKLSANKAPAAQEKQRLRPGTAVMPLSELCTEEKCFRAPAGHSGITAGPTEEQPDPEIKQSPFCIRRFCGNQKTAARRDTGRDKKTGAPAMESFRNTGGNSIPDFPGTDRNTSYFQMIVRGNIFCRSSPESPGHTVQVSLLPARDGGTAGIRVPGKARKRFV